MLTATAGPHGERHGARDVVEGVPVHRLAIPLPFGVPVNPFAPRDVRAILLAGRYDVVHVHAGVVSPFAYDGLKVALDLGRPVVVTWHCVLGHSEPLGRVWGRLRDWSSRPIAFTAVSDVAAEPLRRILGAGAEVRVLPNGVDVTAWRAPAIAHGDEVRLVSAMRLARRKRPIPLLRMVSAARDRVPETTRIQLSILGSGPQRALMRAVIRRHRMTDWVDLPGRLDHTELVETYRRSDVYIAPAQMESFGIAAIEARAAGLPIVARSDSGIREFVQHDVEGLLADGDEAMVDAIARMVTDPALRQRISAYNHAHPPVQDWDHVVAVADLEYARAARILGRVAA